jgi:hypothetical protein
MDLIGNQPVAVTHDPGSDRLNLLCSPYPTKNHF